MVADRLFRQAIFRIGFHLAILEFRIVVDVWFWLTRLVHKVTGNEREDFEGRTPPDFRLRRGAYPKHPPLAPDRLYQL